MYGSLWQEISSREFVTLMLQALSVCSGFLRSSYNQKLHSLLGEKLLNYSDANLVLISVLVQPSSGILWRGIHLFSATVFSVRRHLSRVTKVTHEALISNDCDWV